MLSAIMAPAMIVSNLLIPASSGVPELPVFKVRLSNFQRAFEDSTLPALTAAEPYLQAQAMQAVTLMHCLTRPSTSVPDFNLTERIASLSPSELPV
jgi:hypothetical protein